MRFFALAFLLSTTVVGHASPASDDPWFKADTLEIAAGGSAKLNWHWNLATRGYLTSVGLVEHPSGDTVSVSPIETTSYVLILEAPGFSPRILTQHLVVRGGKGKAGVWPDDPFTPLAYKADHDIRSTSLAEAAARVRNVLQDDRGFEIQEFSQDDQVVFLTAFLQSSNLNEPNESPRRFWRIAHRVALDPTQTSGLIRLHLSSAIQWRIVVDNRWFLENSSSSDRYQRQMKGLWNAFGFRGN